MTTISQAREQWANTTLKKTLDRFPERQAEFETSSGIPVDRLYTPPDEQAGDYCPGSAFRATTPTRAASSRRCTAAASGPCASTPASARPSRATSATAICWIRARPA